MREERVKHRVQQLLALECVHGASLLRTMAENHAKNVLKALLRTVVLNQTTY